MTRTTQPLSPATISPRLRPVAHGIVAFLVLAYILVGLASFVLYWPVGQQVCALSVDECGFRLQFTAAQATAFAAQGIPFTLMVALRYGGLVLGALIGTIVGLMLFWRRRDDWMALLTVLLFLSYAGSNGGITGAEIRALPRLTFPVSLLSNVWPMVFILFLGLFPNGRVAPPWLKPLFPVIVILFMGIAYSQIANTLQSPIEIGVLAMVFLTLLSILLAGQVIRYRRYSTVRERQQVKWAFLGITLMMVLLAFSIVMVIFEPSDNLVIQFLSNFIGFNLGMALLPIFIGIAILRSRLWDIDILIRRTLIYGLLTVSLAVVYLGIVVVLQQLFRALTGQGSDVAIIVSTLAIAALFIPLRNRIQRTIDHRFYRRKYNAAHVLSALAATVRDEVDLGRLTDELQTVVEETMQPEHLSLWLKKQGKGRS